MCLLYQIFFYLFITLEKSHRSLDDIVTVTVRRVHALPAEVKLLLVITFKYTKLSCKVYRKGLPGDSFFRQIHALPFFADCSKQFFLVDHFIYMTLFPDYCFRYVVTM